LPAEQPLLLLQLLLEQPARLGPAVATGPTYWWMPRLTSKPTTRGDAHDERGMNLGPGP